MLQPRRGPDLAQESLTAERRAEVGVEHLDGDVAIVLEVVREVDCRHAARAELALDAVMAGQGAGQAGEDVVVRHGGTGREGARAATEAVNMVAGGRPGYCRSL